jgi:phosphate transport system permease protein
MTTMTAPSSAEVQRAQDVPTPQRRIRLRAVTADSVSALAGAAAGALGLTWVLYERVLPMSGALGFWLVWYVLFLCGYAAVTALTGGNGQAVIDRLVAVVMTSAALLVLAIIGNQIGYTVFRGWSALLHIGNFVTQTMALAGPLEPLSVGGVLHAIVGSLEQMGIATAISVPLGLLAALFLSEVGGRLARPVRAIVEAMTALPEIIAGLFIYAMVILTFGLRQSGFAAGLALAVMMIPFVTRSAEVMLRLVPGNLREASLALGASQWRTAWLVVLPTARSGLTTAVVLAMARAIGETAPVLITAGFTTYMHANPFQQVPQTSLPLYIFSYVKLPQATEIARAFGAGLVLMFIVLVLFTIARVIGGKEPGQLSRRQRRRIARDAWHESERPTHAAE